MINEENLNKLYNGIVNGNELTTKELNSYGFNSKDLSDLIEQGSLERLKRGHYSFKSIDDLYTFGQKLKKQKEYDKANDCFLKCYELDPNHLGPVFQLFLTAIIKRDYNLAFEYFEKLYETNNKYYISDCNFYLYLLNIITDIPEKYKEYTRYLKFEDIRVDFLDNRYENIEEVNKIRSDVLRMKFPYALKQINDLINKQDTVDSLNFITRVLLLRTVEIENNSKNILIDLAKNKSYEEILKHLKEREKRHNLSITDDYTVKLINVIINIEKTNDIPKKTLYEAETLFDAIDGNNYELALELSDKYNQKTNIDSKENTIYILLLEICNLIKKYSSKSEKIVDHNKERLIEEKQNSVEEQKSVSINTSFSLVISFLMKGDLENAFRTLRNYLESINKKEYEFLIVGLIKLSLLEKDVAFTKPMIALTYVSRENFKFDISNYIQEFYITLSQNKFDEARIYLDIISKANKLGQDCILTDGLLQVLNNAEAIINYKRNNTILDNVENAFEKSNSLYIIEDKKNEPLGEDLTEIKNDVLKENNDKIKIEATSFVTNKNKTIKKPICSEEEFIDSKHKLLLEHGGIILLKPMSSERRKVIHQIVKNYKDMVSFSIGEGENRQIVLRYKQFIEGYVDFKSLLTEADKAYEEGNYNLCIKNYLELLKFGKPKTFVYAKLGLAYMKKYNKNKAIQYLTIANELNKQEKGNFDFTNVIDSLRGVIPEEDKKTMFKMGIKEFDNDIEDYYGIESFDEISSYIQESGLDVESACQNLNMTSEQIDIIRLIYAREFYSQGNYEKGDQFVNSVEKSKNKTKYTLKILEEIRKNKKFYINRTNKNQKQLALTLQPRKIK